MRKLLFLLMTLTACCVAVQGQGRYSKMLTQRQLFNHQGRNAVFFDMGVGASMLYITTDLGSCVPGVAFRFEPGYTYYWNRNWGFHTGLGINYSSSSLIADKHEVYDMGEITAYLQPDRTGPGGTGPATRSSHYTATIGSITEKYSALVLEVPLQMALQSDGFWMNFGLKAQIPVSVKCDYDYARTSIGVGYEIDGFGTSIPVPMEIDFIPAQKGTYDVASISKSSENIDYPLYVLASVSGGYRWALTENQIFYLGLYVDVAVNSTKVGGKRPLVEMDEVISGQRHMLHSDAVSAMRYIDFGLTLKYSVTYGKRIGYTAYGESAYRTYRRAYMQ